MSFFKREVLKSTVYANDLSGSVYCVAIEVKPSRLQEMLTGKSKTEHQTGMVYLGSDTWYTPSLGAPKYGSEFTKAPKWASEIFSDLLAKWLLNNWGVPIEEREVNTFDRMEEDLDDLGMLNKEAKRHRANVESGDASYDLLVEDLVDFEQKKVAVELKNAVDRSKA